MRSKSIVVQICLTLFAYFFSGVGTTLAASITGLCTSDEEVVWECPIKSKAVALCASKGKASIDTTIQYRYGKPGKIEL